MRVYVVQLGPPYRFLLMFFIFVFLTIFGCCIFYGKRRKKEEKRRNKKKSIWRSHLENINPHKHTSEASICKSGFPEKNTPLFFYKAKFSFLVMMSAKSHFFCEKLILKGSIYASFQHSGFGSRPYGRSTFSKRVGRKRSQFRDTFLKSVPKSQMRVENSPNNDLIS